MINFVISQFFLKHIKILQLIPIFVLSICLEQALSSDLPPYGKISFPFGATIEVDLAISPKDQKSGLSGVKNEKFATNRGLLFIYKKMGPRVFWMPNTYFNLDIIFLDDKFKVVDIERNMPAHPGLKQPPAITTTKQVNAQFVLEMKASSPIASKIGKGMQLKWISSHPLESYLPEETKSDTHLLK
ncbi:MAG: DUF192 domain-containing protein [Bacteriovoracaceae bacterium]|nr:DUF192 domain-containing protein [Bacteriovoracaceae bacterium]